jgi:hypothetical protein
MSSAEEVKSTENPIHPFVFFQKPVIGSTQDEEIPPVEIIFPYGGYALGLPIKDPLRSAQNPQQRENDIGILASGPMLQNVDIEQKRSILLGFLVICLVNFILTITMYANADIADPSKVEPGHGYLTTAFESVSKQRTSIENINFAFTLLLMFVGSYSIITDNTLGISSYALGATLNFFLATYSLPYFLYGFRYILDFVMVYLILVYRSRLTYTYLPIHFHRQ